MDEKYKTLLTALFILAFLAGLVVWILFKVGVLSNKCGKNGRIRTDDTCNCNPGYTGEKCETKA